MKVIYYSNQSDNNSYANIISVDARLHINDSDSSSKIEFVIIKSNGTIEQKEIFRTKNKVDKFLFFTPKEEKYDLSVYFLICLNNYEKVIFFSLDLSNINSNELKELSLQDNLEISILDTGHFHCNHNRFNENKQEPVDDAKINFLHSYMDQNNYRIFVIAGLIFSNWFTLIKIKIQQNYSKNNIEGHIQLKNFRQTGFEFAKIFYSCLKRDFTGDNYELITANFYDKYNKSLINFQKILVPNLETELIMNYDFLSIKLDDSSLMRSCFKFSKTNVMSEIFYFFYYYENYFHIVFFEEKNFSIKSEFRLNENELISDVSKYKETDFENIYVDYLKIIKNHSKDLYVLFLITNNKNLKIFEIESDLRKKGEIHLKNTDFNINHAMRSNFKIFEKNNCIYLKYLISLNDIVCIEKINIEKEKLEPFTKYSFDTTNIKNLPLSKQTNQLQIILEETVIHNPENSRNIHIITEEKLTVKNYNDHYNEIIKSYCEFKDSDFEFEFEMESEYEFELISFLSGGLLLIELKNKLFLYDYLNHKIKKNFCREEKLKFEFSRNFLDVYEKVFCNKILLITKRYFVVYDWKKDLIEQEDKFGEKDEMLFSVKNENENLLYFVFKDKVETYCIKSLKKLNIKLSDNQALFSGKLLKAKCKNMVLILIKNIIHFVCFENSSFKVTSKDYNEKQEINIDRIYLSERNFFILAHNFLHVHSFKINEGYSFLPQITIEFPKCYFINYDLEILRSSENKNFEMINFIFVEKKEKIIKKIILFNVEGKNSFKDSLILLCPNKHNYKTGKNSDVIYSCSKQEGDRTLKMKIWKSIQNNFSISTHSLYSFSSKGSISKIRSIKHQNFQGNYLIGFYLTDKKLPLNNTLEIKAYSNDSLKISDLIQIDFDSNNKMQDYNVYLDPMDGHIIIFILLCNITKKSNSLIFLKFEKLCSVNLKCLFLDKSPEDFSINEINSYDIDNITDFTKSNSEYVVTKRKCLELEWSAFFTDIILLIGKNTLILNSKYGQLKFVQFDEFCNSQVLYECSYSSHLIEISSLKSQYDNKEDLDILFTLDESMLFIDFYELFNCLLIDCEKIMKKQNGVNDNLNEMCVDSINNNFIMLFYNFGIIVYRVQIDLLTNFSQISFYQQISFENKIYHLKPKFIRHAEDFLILLETEKEIFYIRYTNSKFICQIDS